MKGDFTRNTFVPSKSFSRVLMQQGRVQLDADWNEQVAIFWHHLRTMIVDLIGPHGGPERRLGFAVKPKDTLNFQLSGGHYYVGGRLCDVQVPFHYRNQPHYTPPETEHLERNTDYLVYLDVWERHITYIEDDDIREVGLGGPDTATRAQLIYQVKTVALAPGEVREIGGANHPVLVCEELLADKLLEMDRFSSCALAARAYVKPSPEEPCIIPPEARYRGPENQLYRVEIHRPGHEGEASFKWSRENGSVVFPIRWLKTDSESDTTTVALEHLGRDDRFGLQAGDWIEIVDDDYVLQVRAEPLLQVTYVDRTTFQVTLEGTPNSDVGDDVDKHPLVRRWDQKADPDIDLHWGVLVEEAESVDLEDGIQIRFEPSHKGRRSRLKDEKIDEDVKPAAIRKAVYNTGDYWLIPARTGTGDVEWPKKTDANGREVPIATSPQGIKHDYAPLGIITVQDNERVRESYIDCRRQFRALARPVSNG